MKPLEHFEVSQDCASFRPVGKMTLQEGVALVTDAITLARERKIRKLLVNVTGLTGFPSPTLPERYFFAREWAAAAKSSVQIAFVAPVAIIDPEKFGILVARNAGLDGDVFADEAEALKWLSTGPSR